MFAQISLWLLWIVLQCSMVGIIAILLMLPLSRSRPDTRGRLAMAGLAAMGIVLLAGIIPGSGWMAPMSDEPPQARSMEVDETLFHSTGSAVPPDAALVTNAPSPNAQPLSEQWQQLTAWFVPAETQSPLEVTADNRQPVRSSSPWMLWFAGVLGIAQLLAICRIVGGLWALKLLERRSRPCVDADMQQRMLRLSSQSGVEAPLDLALIDRLQTPAVVGWKRFTILLPDEFEQWSSSQRDSVLAHELAHIKRCDAWWRAVAVLLQALHFYNPLAFALSRRYTLEQELAADKLACEWLGDRESYLQSLASLALRKAPPVPAWSALAFLPPRSMFLRRLEMLREVPRHFSQATERVLQFGSLALLIAAAMVVGGLRPLSAQAPNSPSATETEASPLVAATESSDTTLPELIPARFGVSVSEVNVARLLKSPKIVAALDTNRNVGDSQTPSLGNTLQQQLTVVPHSQVESVLLTSFGKELILIKAKQPFSFPDSAPMKIFPSEDKTTYFMLITPKILARSTPDVLDQLSQFLSQPPTERQSLATLLPPTDSVMRTTLNWQAIKSQVLESREFVQSPYVSMVRPIAETSQIWRMTVDAGEAGTPLTMKITGSFPSTDDATTAEETMKAGKILLKNMAVGVKGQLQAADQKQVFDLGIALLDAAQVKTDDKDVVVTSTLDRSLDEMVTVFAPAIIASRMAAERMNDTNRLKQIMLAMHNYHDMYGHLPMSAMIDPDSGVPHSWRVELLPLIGEEELYKMYRMDEPWDSEANRKVLERMPAIYGNAGSPGGNSTCFFSIVGKNTALAPFSDGDEGSREKDVELPSGNVKVRQPRAAGDAPTFASFTDGLSNTVMIIQTKKAVPWTKPEDIPLAEAAAAKLGGFHPGGFLMGISDGAVRFVTNTVDPQVWQRLIIRNDGEPVNLN